MSARIEEVKEQEPQDSPDATGTNNLIEFSFFTIETTNRYETLEDDAPDRERWQQGVHRGGRQGDSGWRRCPAPGRGRRKPRPSKQPESAPEWEGGQIGVIRQPPARIPIAHMVYDFDRGWQQAAIMTSPTLPVRFSVCRSACTELQLSPPCTVLSGRLPKSVVKRAVADTGAQLNVLDSQTVRDMGIDPGTLTPTTTQMKGAGRSSQLDVEGSIFLSVEIPGERTVRAVPPQQFYVVSNVSQCFLSRRCLMDLGVIDSSFPNAGDKPVIAENQAAGKCEYDGVGNCNCPARELPPSEPAALPCEPTTENIPRLEQYIRDRYKASSFNTCCRQKIPTLKGSPPLTFHVDPKATPVACHKPAAVPLHWQEAVRETLERDVRLGVLERVPYNTPVKWMSRMVCTPKHDGSPRRTVDYTAVNAHCPRQTHHTPSPWHLAAGVPSESYKTVLDNWNGYHSVSLATEEDRDLTTFITPWGRFRYKVAPQGFLSSGDGFTERMDGIYEGTERMKRCVDDSLLHDTSIREQFVRTCRFLDLGGNHGAIFNPSKFQFCKKKSHMLDSY